MTLYELLCCYKSPAWYYYQDPLNPKYSYFRQGIERNLPPECVDSYLGRLLQAAIVVNDSWSTITAETFSAFIEASKAFEVSGDVGGRRFHQKTESKIRAYLATGLPAAWIVPLFQAHSVACYTKNGSKTSLNNIRFYDALQNLACVSYPPTQAWFKKHPKFLSKDTPYCE